MAALNPSLCWIWERKNKKKERGKDKKLKLLSVLLPGGMQTRLSKFRRMPQDGSVQWCHISFSWPSEENSPRFMSLRALTHLIQIAFCGSVPLGCWEELKFGPNWCYTCFHQCLVTHQIDCKALLFYKSLLGLLPSHINNLLMVFIIPKASTIGVYDLETVLGEEKNNGDNCVDLFLKWHFWCTGSVVSESGFCSLNSDWPINKGMLRKCKSTRWQYRAEGFNSLLSVLNCKEGREKVKESASLSGAAS